jgi:hypothetical protein
MTFGYRQVLSAARRLPKRSQIELASALLAPAKARFGGSLEPLNGLSETELRALAASVLAPAHTRRLKLLLRMNREGKLSRELRAELDRLLEECDQVALLKSRALYTLSRR